MADNQPPVRTPRRVHHYFELKSIEAHWPNSLHELYHGLRRGYAKYWFRTHTGFALSTNLRDAVMSRTGNSYSCWYSTIGASRN